MRRSWEHGQKGSDGKKQLRAKCVEKNRESEEKYKDRQKEMDGEEGTGRL